jgi:chromosome segregation ATPase
MRVFCVPENGFRFGRNGSVMRGQCPGDLAEAFGYAHADGRRVHDAEEALRQGEMRVTSLERERREIDDDISSNEDALAAATSDEDRARHEGELSRLARERRRINDDIRVAQSALPDLRRAISDLRYEIGNRWGPW